MPEKEATDYDDYIDPGQDEIDPAEAPPPAAGEDADKAAKADKTAKAAKTAKGGNKEGEDLHEEVRSLRARLGEAETAAQYWHGQARNGSGGTPAAAKKEEAAPTLSVDLVDAISSGNAADIRKAMSELGFVDQATLQQHVSAARQAGAQETAIYREFPELRDSTTPFFRSTQEQFAELVADGADPNSLATTKAAARLARAEVDNETRRGTRVSRQSGDRGRAPSRGRDGGNDDELDATQSAIIRGFQSAGATTVTEETYRKRASAGVRMSGVKTRRAA